VGKERAVGGDPPEVLERFRRQHGLITMAQAVDGGLSRATVARRVTSGLWVRKAAGLYRHAAVADSWHAGVLGPCLQLGAIASHRSAAFLWELDGIRRGRAEVVVSRSCRSSVVGARVHRSVQFDAIGPVTRRGIPTTPIERTLIDLAGVVGWGKFEAAIDDALRRELTGWPDLLATYRALGRRGRNGSAGLRRVLDERFGDDHVPRSAWSRWVSALLVDAGLPEPRLEYPVHRVDGTLIGHVDLAFPAQRLAVELQSVRYHLNRPSFESDAVRAADLAAAGWTWLPLTWRRHRESSAAVVATVRATLHRARPTDTTHPPKLA
jgi:hypothetical protein